VLVNNSLRFRSSASAYLNRTPPVASNRKTWTWSGWVKRGTIGSGVAGNLFQGGTTSSDTGSTSLSFFADKLYVQGYSTNWIITNAVYRDPSAWYHVVLAMDSTQATGSNRLKLYINGSEVSYGTYNNLTQNTDYGINQAASHVIGQSIASFGGGYFDGYLAEVNFIDGQQLTPSSFGTTSDLGVWQPIRYGGSYGTNGFYLKFTDTTSTTTLGYDFSPNGNNWTTNNISLTAGSTYDSMTDVPTLTSATVANYCVMSPIDNGGNTLSNGNLTVVSPVGTAPMTKGTFGVSSGKWYWEVTPTVLGSSSIGIAGATVPSSETVGTNPLSWGYLQDARKYNNTSATSYGSSYTTNDVIGVALDMDAGTLTYYKNNSSQGQAFSGITGTVLPALGDFSADPATTWQVNFGQRPFTYTAPANHLALNTFNLPTPTIGATASELANKYFDATLYVGNNAAQTITNAGLFQPDWVWTKARANAYSPNLYDSVRGVNQNLQSNSTGADFFNANSLTSFNTNGFTLGLNDNGNASSSSVAWQWRASNATAVTNTNGSITSTVSANTTAGFSIVTYTGTGSNATVGHGLGVAPSMIITKYRGVESWAVYHKSTGNTQYLTLDTTNAAASASTVWQNTSPTSTVFSVGTAGLVNTSGGSGMVAYCFAEVAGYSAFGSYTGNGSTDGPFIFTGFRPRWIMFKQTSSSGAGWLIYDSARNTYNLVDLYLQANQSNAEAGNSTDNPLDFLSNGFKLRYSNSATNQSGATYIYMAFAENPFKYANAR
jgi:hypothetical protein